MIKSLEDVLEKWRLGERVFYVSLRGNKMPLNAYDKDKIHVVTALFYRGIKFGVFK